MTAFKYHVPSLIRAHYVAILLSLVVGGIMVAPQLWFIYSAGNEYQGIVMSGSDAESHYLARVQESVEGGGVGNPYFAEDKKLPTSQLTYIETVLAIPSILFGVSVPVMNLWYKFVFPGLIFLLAYFLAFRLTRNRSASLASAALAILGTSLFSFGDVKNLLTWNTVYENFATYARPVNPSVSGVLFFTYLHVLLSFWRGSEVWKKKLLYVVSLAILFALSPYVYFYTWTFLAVLNGFVFIGLLYEARFRDAVHVVFATALGLLSALPYIQSIIAFTTHPLYADVSKTFGFIFSHAPRLSIVGGLIILFFAGALWWAKKWNTETKFITILLLTAIVVINQQVLTGRLLQEGHYHWYFNIPIFAIALWYGIVTAVEKLHWPKYAPFLAGVAIILSVGAGAFIQGSSYVNLRSHALEMQVYGPLFEWLNTNATPQSVVLADNEISEWIPVYTNHNVYWSNFGFTYLTAQVRVMHALYMYLRLFGITPKEMPESAFHVPTVGGEKAYQYHETSVLLGDKKTYLTGFYPDGMATFYGWFYGGDMNVRLRDYGVQYVVVDTRREQAWLSVIPKSAKKVFENGPIILFKL